MKRTLELAAYAHEFDLSKPFDSLPRRVQNLILYGNPPRKRGHEKNGATGAKAAPPRERQKRRIPLPGIVGLLEKNFEESSSDAYREWMTQYMSPVP